MRQPPAFPRRWNVGGAVQIAETFSSRIWKVVRADGSPAVIKALKPVPDVEDELRGAHFLAWRRGESAVRLYGRDRGNMLLEYAGDRPLTAVLDAEGDAAATEIAGEVLAKLHAPSIHPAPSQLQPLRERFASLFGKAEAEQCGLYHAAATVADRVLDDARDVRPLHGDVHHENIMHGTRGWLAIDPKGVIGDPCFDAANLFYNPLDREQLCRDPERIAQMAATLARSMNQDPRRLLDHAFAYGCLSAAWYGEDGGDAALQEGQCAIAEAIRAVRLSF